MCNRYLNTMLGEFPVADAEDAFAPRRPAAGHKVDRQTFNYGRALGRPRHDEIYDALVAPWDQKDRAAQYDMLEGFAHSAGAIGLQFTHASWALDMALRDIRCAETPEEQATAFEKARELYFRLDRRLERPAAGGIKYFRYGRIGEVLRHFNPFARR